MSFEGLDSAFSFVRAFLVRGDELPFDVVVGNLRI